jgi:hypothetical protein
MAPSRLRRPRRARLGLESPADVDAMFELLPTQPSDDELLDLRGPNGHIGLHQLPRVVGRLQETWDQQALVRPDVLSAVLQADVTQYLVAEQRRVAGPPSSASGSFPEAEKFGLLAIVELQQVQKVRQLLR